MPIDTPDWKESTFVPILKQNSATVAATVTEASYQKNLQTSYVTVVCRLDPTAGGTTNTAINVTLPAELTAGYSARGIGHWMFFDASAGAVYGGMVHLNTTTLLDFWTGGGSGNVLGVIPNLPLTSGDFLEFFLNYRVAR